MLRRLILFTALVYAIMPSHGADYRKMSAYVLSMMSRQESRPALARGTGGNPYRTGSMMAFVSTESAESADIWQEYGCKVYAQAGNIAIVNIPLCRLGDLSDHPAVRRIEASPSAHIAMDTTVAIVNTLPLYKAQPPIPAMPLTGKGVVVGVMDIGFDLTHPNFYDRTATNYRIGAFWDQLSKDTVGISLPVGRDFVGNDLVLAQQHSVDGLLQTHGTHTLGIAAGSGYQSPYRGFAFDADICIVSNSVSEDLELIDSADVEKYTTATDALGFKYIFDYAGRQGKPCVASFSEGYPPYLDNIDSLYAAFLDSLTGPGRIIVASAGNESVAKTYAEKPKGTEAAGAFVMSAGKKLYYRLQADSPFGLTLYAYGNGSDQPSSALHMTTEDLPTDTLLTDTLFMHGDTCAVSVERYTDAFGKSLLFSIDLTTNRPMSELPPVALVIEGAGSHVKLYGSSSSQLANFSTDRRWNAAENSHNIHAPACFPSVICVAATAHRLGFTNYQGEYKDFSEGRTAGRRSPYSSVGPTIDGRCKPDVSAPGDNIISSYSSFYLETKPDASDIGSDVEHFGFNGRTYAWNANSGTSMATPAVAGIIALWLQAKPDLTPQEAMAAISRTCHKPDDSLDYPNNYYGYGEIDAYRGLLDILGIDHITQVSSHQPAALRATVDEGRLCLHFSTVPTAPLRIRLFSLNGTLVHETSLLAAEATVPVVLPALPTALYAVQIDCTDRRFTGSQLVRLSR